MRINGKEDVVPYVFIRYSNVIMRDCSLRYALRSPSFHAYHDSQPFKENMLRPCPMLENPERLRKMVTDTGAVSADYESPKSVDHRCDKTTPYAENWTSTAEKLAYWDETRTDGATC